MARLARVVSRGLPHPVMQPGNGRQQTLFRMPTTRRILICLFRQSWHTVRSPPSSPTAPPPNGDRWRIGPAAGGEGMCDDRRFVPVLNSV
jgi:hypothetical protein